MFTTLNLVNMLFGSDCNKTCSLCLKINANNININEKVEIYSNEIKIISIEELLYHLFSWQDVILQQVCRDCFNLIIKVHSYHENNKYIRKLLHKVVDQLQKVLMKETFNIDEKDNTQVILDLNVGESKKKVIPLNALNNLGHNTSRENLNDCASIEKIDQKASNINECKIVCKLQCCSKDVYWEQKTPYKINIEPANGIKIKEKICHKCGKVLKTQKALRSHMNCHNQKRCPYCSKTLKTHSHYKIHVQNHTTKKQRVRRKQFYNCNDCTYKSFYKDSLEAHIFKMHLNIQPYICGICLKGFYKKRYLTEHIVSHKNTKTATCDLCGSSFVNRKCLIEHQRIHFNVKPYKCEICEKDFVTAGRRTDHYKRLHKPKLETCLICQKSYGIRSELNRHIKLIHSN